MGWVTRRAGPLLFRFGGAWRLQVEPCSDGVALYSRRFAMKKVAIGCGIVLVVALIGGTVGMYVVYNKARAALASFTELGKVPDLERQVRNRSAFMPPGSGELTPDRIATYVAVRELVRQEDGATASSKSTRSTNRSWSASTATSTRRSTWPS